MYIEVVHGDGMLIIFFFTSDPVCTDAVSLFCMFPKWALPVLNNWKKHGLASSSNLLSPCPPGMMKAISLFVTVPCSHRMINFYFPPSNSDRIPLRPYIAMTDGLMHMSHPCRRLEVPRDTSFFLLLTFSSGQDC